MDNFDLNNPETLFYESGFRFGNPRELRLNAGIGWRADVYLRKSRVGAVERQNSRYFVDKIGGGFELFQSSCWLDAVARAERSFVDSGPALERALREA